MPYCRPLRLSSTHAPGFHRPLLRQLWPRAQMHLRGAVTPLYFSESFKQGDQSGLGPPIYGNPRFAVCSTWDGGEAFFAGVLILRDQFGT